MNSVNSNSFTPDANAAPMPKLEPKKSGTVVYACSGCSDVGELADRIARRLAREGAAEMSCLAGIGGRVKPLVNKAASAERILAVDGCPLNCTRHTLELAGFDNFEHLELHKLGMRKHSSPVTDERIAAGVEAAKKILFDCSGGLRPSKTALIERRYNFKSRIQNTAKNSVELANQIS